MLLSGLILTSGCTGIFPQDTAYIQDLPTPAIRSGYQMPVPTNNSSSVPKITEAQSPLITTDTPSPDSGLNIVLDKTEVPLNSTLELSLENRGPEKAEFISGFPFSVEYYGSSGWILIAGHGGGTQGFWTLDAGNTSRKMVWNTASAREYLDAGLLDKSVVKETGRFRICVHAYIGGYPQGNDVVRCKDFVVTL